MLFAFAGGGVLLYMIPDQYFLLAYTGIEILKRSY